MKDGKGRDSLPAVKGGEGGMQRSFTPLLGS